MNKIILILLISIGLFACGESETKSENTEKNDPNSLQSWNDSESKNRIVEYVSDVTNPDSKNFIPVEDRIATFDNDGTLWAEKPMYFQLLFAFNRIAELAKQQPELEENIPYKYVLNGDIASLLESHDHIFKIIEISHSNLTVEEFTQLVQDWLRTTRHHRFNVEYNRMTYLPMIELVDYLKAHEFKVYIVSGGGVDFMRAWAPQAYGIPSEQIIGSSMKSKLVQTDSTAEVVKLPALDFFNDKEAKPVAIQKHIGKKPVIAVGNSDGDLQMLQFSADNQYNSLQIYIHHTDGHREFQYDRNSSIGKLDKGLDEATSNNWVVVSMKDDWKKIWKWN